MPRLIQKGVNMSIVELAREIKDLGRLRQILTVFLELGFGYTISRLRLSKYVPLGKRIKQKFKGAEERPLPERIRIAFEKLGPTFIKLGQLLSLRPDIIPPEYIKEFEKMQDKVPGFPYSQVERIIQDELGKPINKLFKQFDKKPISAASLGQVHKAKLPSGEIVAVKIQRPDIKEKIEQDIEILHRIANLLQNQIKELKNLMLTDLIDEFKHYTMRELNYNYEATNAEIMRKNLLKDKKVVIPKVYRKLTTEKVLTMEHIDGIPINQVKEVKKLGRNYIQVIDTIYESLITQIYDYGFFHADPHPANILVLKKGRKIAFVDFGIVGRFDEELRNKSVSMFMAIMNRDTEGMIKTMLALGILDEYQINRAKLKQDLHDLIEQMQYASLKEVRASEALEQIMQIALKHKITLPLDFVLYAKTIITLEGIGLRYNPDFKLIEQTRPLLTKIIRKKYSPKSIAKYVTKTATQYQELIEELPLKATEALTRISKGKIDLDIEDADISSITYEMEQSVGNLSIGIIIAALIMSSSIVYQIETTFKYGSIPILSLAGLGIAFFLMIWLVHRTIFAKPKRW